MKGENEMPGSAARTFEELHIYQRARELTKAVYALTRAGTFAKDHGLADQIRRATVSIMSNIAEGFERGATTEFIQFLYIAKGSCGEVRAQLQVALDQGYIVPEQHSALVDLARRTSGMISNFIAHLQSSDYRGEKFSRPHRQVADQAEQRRQALRKAQLVNIRAQQRHYEQPPVRPPAADPSPSSSSSSSSHPSHP
jgi:four helix bundle protein